MFPGFNLRIAKGARTPGQIHFAKMGLSEDEIPLKEASRRIRSYVVKGIKERNQDRAIWRRLRH